MDENWKVRQIIHHNGIEIRLLDVTRSDIPYESVANIIAVDSLGNRIWKVEPPRTKYEQYWDMRIDSAKGVLVANTGSSYQHLISLEDGKIIDAYLVK